VDNDFGSFYHFKNYYEYLFKFTLKYCIQIVTQPTQCDKFISTQNSLNCLNNIINFQFLHIAFIGVSAGTEISLHELSPVHARPDMYVMIV
jgi:hypothetical protein